MTRSQCAWLALRLAAPYLLLAFALLAIVAYTTRNRD